ncbi:MAG: putative Ig domain-containing protein [Terriglobales bacterium]
MSKCSAVLPLNAQSREMRTRFTSVLAIFSVALALLSLTSCGSANATGNNSDANVITVSANLPTGEAGQRYNGVLSVSGGSAPYQFMLKSGSLPPGMSLNSASGSLAGMLVAPGTYTFEVVVTDAPQPGKGTQTFTIQVKEKSVTVSLSPTSVQLSSSQTAQFSASVGGTSNTAVTWSATVGTISTTGLYTAPAVNATTSAVITATSAADRSKNATAAVVISPATSSPLTITSGNPPDAQMNSLYDDALTASGGTQPYTWSVASGTLPNGLTLSASGDLAGTPTSTGTFSFAVAVTDSANNTAQSSLSLGVLAASNFDGPAELPRFQVASSMADTPAPGNVIQVSASADPQTAINNANCGDTVELQAGAAYSGILTLPAKSCDDQHWIIIRTSAPDSALPAEGQRLTPCYAGFASLPNRPDYTCSQAKNVLAKFWNPGKADAAPIILAGGANHYRLIGLEITRPVDKVAIVELVSVSPGTAADHIVIDRCWVHGTAQDETRRGIFLGGTTNVAIVDSYLSDFHCTSITGTCIDSQAISGGGGGLASGPWKIQNNFIEAAGENIMFGGSRATIVPADITISNNHLYKVPQWQEGMPGFVGGYSGRPFAVKNHFEIKNATRVLLEGNILEYNWGGFTQHGHTIMITPRNVWDGKTNEGNLCPICEATDVTIRYNRISHVGGGIAIASGLSDGFGASADERFSIHDIIVDDVDSTKYQGGGSLFLLMNAWPKPVLNTISIRHVTGFPDHHLLVLTNSLHYPEMYGFTFQDNLVATGSAPVWAAGGNDSCASSDKPIIVIPTCFKTYTFSTNVLAAYPSVWAPARWPSGNMFATAFADVQFVNYNNGNGGNYQLAPGSPYKGKASDGTDPGANIGAVNAAILGVE